MLMPRAAACACTVGPSPGSRAEASVARTMRPPGSWMSERPVGKVVIADSSAEFIASGQSPPPEAKSALICARSASRSQVRPRLVTLALKVTRPSVGASSKARSWFRIVLTDAFTRAMSLPMLPVSSMTNITVRASS